MLILMLQYFESLTEVCREGLLIFSGFHDNYTCFGSGSQNVLKPVGQLNGQAGKARGILGQFLDCATERSNNFFATMPFAIY